MARNDDELAALLAAEQDATNILLNDWTHELSDVVFARYLETGAFPSYVDSILSNGQGRVQCLPESILKSGPGLGIEPEASRSATMSSMLPVNSLEQRDMHDMSRSSPTMSTSQPTASEMPDMGGMDSLSPRGCMPPMMFKPGFDMSSLPPESCTNTTSPLLTVPANQSEGWLALNLVNSGAVSALRVSLDGHSMFVYSADGLYTKLQEVNVSISAVLPCDFHSDSLGASHRTRPALFCHGQA